MKAIVLNSCGGPESLTYEERAIPKPRRGEVLIRVKAFGLNQIDARIRNGAFPRITLPRILGMEAVGLVEDAPAGEFAQGDVVATAMGGMAREFDGSYAEFTCVPTAQVQLLKTKLPWKTLGAIPEILLTAWGSLFKSLRLEKRERLLIRGGSTPIGLSAAALAKNHGAHVSATTRSPAHERLLRENGVEQVFMDTASIAEQVREVYPGGVDKILELIGPTTLQDSLLCAKQRGIVCVTGIIGNMFSVRDFSPIEDIPTSVCLTCYTGNAKDFMETPLQHLVDEVSAGSLHLPIARTFAFGEIVAAHHALDESIEGGKIVMLV